ncbi:hypothetical protein EON66_03950 [archaeon]|nr:MAG: hypothetical protein EON66_03950 [archaeon]
MLAGATNFVLLTAPPELEVSAFYPMNEVCTFAPAALVPGEPLDVARGNRVESLGRMNEMVAALTQVVMSGISTATLVEALTEERAAARGSFNLQFAANASTTASTIGAFCYTEFPSTYTCARPSASSAPLHTRARARGLFALPSMRTRASRVLQPSPHSRSLSRTW